jgi:hypothetical protein
MTVHRLIPEDHAVESLEEGGTWLLDLVAAVDHLRRGIRPGITVWDAIEEAIRWHTPGPDTDQSDGIEPAWGDPDPLRGTLIRFLGCDMNSGPTAVGAQTAVRHWVLTTAARYNDGRHWPHPAPRRSFPPPMLATDLLDEPSR